MGIVSIVPVVLICAFMLLFLAEMLVYHIKERHKNIGDPRSPLYEYGPRYIRWCSSWYSRIPFLVFYDTLFGRIYILGLIVMMYMSSSWSADILRRLMHTATSGQYH